MLLADVACVVHTAWNLGGGGEVHERSIRIGGRSACRGLGVFVGGGEGRVLNP